MRIAVAVVVGLLVVGIAQRSSVAGGAKAPLRKQVIPAGEGWHCTRDQANRELVTICYREQAGCDGFASGATTATYGECRRKKVAACLTYRNKLENEYEYDCHESFKSCLAHRAWYLDEQSADYDNVSGCHAVR